MTLPLGVRRQPAPTYWRFHPPGSGPAPVRNSFRHHPVSHNLQAGKRKAIGHEVLARAILVGRFQSSNHMRPSKQPHFKTNNAGDYRREKTIEKTVLRILASCTFSHSLRSFSTRTAEAGCLSMSAVPPIETVRSIRSCLSRRVESRCGAVALGRTYLLPPLSSGGALVVQP
jgi:hypothetical protein